MDFSGPTGGLRPRASKVAASAMVGGKEREATCSARLTTPETKGTAHDDPTLDLAQRPHRVGAEATKARKKYRRLIRSRTSPSVS